MSQVTITTGEHPLIRFAYRVSDKLSKYTDVLECLTMTTLNTVIVASKVFGLLSSFWERGSKVLLNYSGVISLNKVWGYVTKSINDFWRAIYARDIVGIVMTAISVTIKATDIFLLFGNLGASVLALCGRIEEAKSFYRIMRPVALASLIALVTLEFATYQSNRSLLGRVKEVKESGESNDRTKKILSAMTTAVWHPENLSSEHKRADRIIAVQIITQLDPDTLKKVTDKLSGYRPGYFREGFEAEIFETLYSSIKLKQETTAQNIGMMALGYMLLGVGRAFPDSVLQSMTNWVVSVLYTSKIVIEQFQQTNLQDKVSEIAT